MVQSTPKDDAVPWEEVKLVMALAFQLSGHRRAEVCKSGNGTWLEVMAMMSRGYFEGGMTGGPRREERSGEKVASAGFAGMGAAVSPVSPRRASPALGRGGSPGIQLVAGTGPPLHPATLIMPCLD